MRTTLTLNDDVAAKLEAESRRAGRPFKEIVNETLRSGLATRRAVAHRQAFKVAAPDVGDLRPITRERSSLRSRAWLEATLSGKTVTVAFLPLLAA